MIIQIQRTCGICCCINSRFSCRRYIPKNSNCRVFIGVSYSYSFIERKQSTCLCRVIRRYAYIRFGDNPLAAYILIVSPYIQFVHRIEERLFPRHVQPSSFKPDKLLFLYGISFFLIFNLGSRMPNTAVKTDIVFRWRTFSVVCRIIRVRLHLNESSAHQCFLHSADCIETVLVRTA